jgi:hypothetical protein
MVKRKQEEEITLDEKSSTREARSAFEEIVASSTIKDREDLSAYLKSSTVYKTGQEIETLAEKISILRSVLDHQQNFEILLQEDVDKIFMTISTISARVRRSLKEVREKAKQLSLFDDVPFE